MGKKGNQKGEKDIEIFERCKNLRYEGKLMSDFWKFFKDAIFLQIPLSNNRFFLFFFLVEFFISKAVYVKINMVGSNCLSLFHNYGIILNPLLLQK